ncbi:hypothetical protein EVAR_10760_1 [Eumeta japonica]|uniref:Uncharacterized protein n=1 Tax=Eumeta variegata TaxID=151549 RepID=A0A4C1W8G7_EUMVA|nr:hypothetical protein EVAR_10760_1 [Eumeta japonica]
MKAECEHSLASTLPQKYLGQYFRQRQVQWKGLSVKQRSRGKRVCEPIKSKWSPPPMDTRSPWRVTDALPAS